MQLSDDQVVRILIAKYKQSGIDLSNILHDPVFNGLPLSSKIDALKEHAREIADGTDDGFNKSDFKSITVGSVMGAIPAALSALPAVAALAVRNPSLTESMLHNKYLWRTAAAAGLLGAVVGGFTSHLANSDKRSARSNSKVILNHIATNPTDTTAVVGLSYMQGFKPDPDSIPRQFAGLIQRRFESGLPTNLSAFYKRERAEEGVPTFDPFDQPT
jgi:hypothetical protein